MTPGLWLSMALAAALSGCTRTVELFPAPPAADAGSEPDAGRAAQPWGSYVGALGLPSCPPGALLEVSDTTTELTGGRSLSDPAAAGPSLSIVEAMWIAANRPGLEVIRFGAEAFPPEAPGVIRPTEADELPADLGPLCLDARDRGVVVDWGRSATACTRRCIWSLGPGSLMAGLVLLRMPASLEVAGGQVAGCRLGTDGAAAIYSLKAAVVEARSGAVVGPHNVLSDAVGLRVSAGQSNVLVIRNDFGWDPVTRVDLVLLVGAELHGDVTLDDNVFGPAVVKPLLLEDGAALARLRNNRFGVDRDGAPFGRSSSGLALGAGAAEVGPFNVFRGLPAAISVGDAARVRISRNSITGNALGIVFQTSPQVPPPSVNSADASGVRGSCLVDGLVEVFSDIGDQGEQFLGDVTCITGSPWSIALAPPRGRNVTATITRPTGQTSAFSAPLAVP
ncbi:MAG: hypothetical protein HYZ28_19155 [Myxococcales bacterium]|nr:hypothetical protein [Myxococcales bacterium]